jgi:hypothetical protein
MPKKKKSLNLNKSSISQTNLPKKIKLQDVLNEYNSSQINLPKDKENDMIIDNIINNHEYMDIDWHLPDLDNKCIIIEELDIDTTMESESRTLPSSDTDDLDFSTLPSNVEDYIEIDKCNGYTINIYKDSIENYIEDYIEYIDNFNKEDYIDNFNKEEEISQIILIPELNDEVTKDKSLSEEYFAKFLNKYISKCNQKFNDKHKIEPFNINTDVIHIFQNGTTNLNNIHLLNDLDIEKSILMFIPIKIYFLNNSHYNVLVIDKKNKTFTYYEPYGDYNNFNMGFKVNNGLNTIKTYLSDKYPKYTYIDAHITNKDKTLGVQKRSEDFFHISEGYCVAWCLYLCYIRMFNFHLDTNFSISTLLNKVFEEYTDVHLLATIKSFITFVKREVTS